MTKNTITWVLLFMLLLCGIGGSYSMSDAFRKDAWEAWETEVSQTAQLLSGSIIGWMEESYAPVSGLAVLYENSQNVSEDEFFGAVDAFEERATTLFLDTHAIARLKNGQENWSIEYSNEPSGILSPENPLSKTPEIQEMIETAFSNPGQIILGPPLATFKDTNYSSVALAIRDANGPLVVMGLLNHDALLKGLIDIHQPEGIQVHIQGRFLGPEGSGPLRTIAGKPMSEALFKVSTRSVSARADLLFTWYASKAFSDGPQERLAEVVLSGGIVASILFTFFIGLLLRQNNRIQIRVNEATEKLTENRGRLDLALASSDIGVWDWDVVNNKAIWDEGHHRIYGTDPTAGTLDHASFLKRIHPDDVAQLETLMNKALAGGEDYRNEFRVLRPDGSVGVVASRAFIIRDKDQNPIRMIGTSMDITERKVGEEKLKQSQQQLKALFDALPVGVVMIGQSGEIREANMISENILGISADEHKMRDLQSKEWKIIRPDGSEMPVDEYPASRALSGEGIIKGVEMGVIRPDGSLVWVSTGAAPISDSAGGGVAVAFEDVTERKEFEQNLKKLSQAVEQSPASIVITDPEGAIEYVNSKFCEVTGYTVEEALDQNPRILKADSSDPELYQELWETIKAGQDWHGEFQNKKKNGELYWESASISPILSSDGSIAYFLAIKEDITERKWIDAELAQKSILMKALIDSPKDIIIFSLDTEYRYAAFNKAHADEMKNVYGSEIKLGLSMLDAVTRQELVPRVKDNLDRVLKGETYSEVQQQPGKDIYYEFNWAAIRNETHRIIGLSAFIRDITDSMRLEAELKSRVKEQDEAQSAMLNMMEDLDEEKAIAEGATRAKSDFLANMSHEIRTPMNAILGLTHLCLQTDLTKKQNDYMTKVHTSATSLLGLINDILDFSKIEAGKLDMESVDFNLEDTLNNVATLVAIKAQEKGLELLFLVPSDIPLSLIGDPLRLGQVLINLANNAVKFTEKGEIIIAVELLEKSTETTKLQFSVRDTGIGLSEEQISKLFQSFSQADTSTTRKYGGTGLGLTISKKLVELMNGSIHVESQPGQGSSFIFTAEFDRQTEQQRVEKITIPDLKGTRTLVVDDSATSREIFSNMLNALNFNVDLARSGEEALERLENASPAYQLVLIDWVMPLMDGIETSQLIRERLDAANQPKIILATSFEKESARRQAGELEINGYLDKPVNPSRLFDAIMNAFGKKSRDIKTGLERAGIDKTSLDPVRGAHILLVEDNEINQQVAQELLEGVGFFVDIANHGREALEKLAELEYDVVLMDIQMPVMDGYEATYEIRSHLDYKDLPVLAMTASATVDDRMRALKSGMNDHIAKPIDPNQLFSTLLKWIKPGDRELPREFTEKKNVTQEIGTDPGEALPDVISGIDIAAGILRVGGNAKLYRNLLSKFSKNQNSAPAEIKTALEEGDLELAERLAHTLKGVSGNIGAMELHAASLDLEAGIKKDHGGVSADLLERVQENLDQVLNSVQTLSNQQSDSESVAGGAIDRNVVDPLIRELMELLEEDDTDAADIVEKLLVILKGSEAGKALSEVEQSIGQYDFEEAMEQLQNVNELLGIVKK